MRVEALHNSQQAAQAKAVSEAQAAEKQASQQTAILQDKVTISAEAQAKLTASAIGADSGHK